MSNFSHYMTKRGGKGRRFRNGGFNFNEAVNINVSLHKFGCSKSRLLIGIRSQRKRDER